MHTQVLYTQLLNPIHAIRSRVDDRLRIAQNQHKPDYKAKVRQTRTFAPGQMVFIERLPLTASPSEIAERLAQFSYNRMTPHIYGPVLFASVTSNKLSIDVNIIFNTVTIDRASTAPNRPQKNGTRQLRTAENSLATDLQESAYSQPQSAKKCAVDRIVEHKGEGQIFVTKPDEKDAILVMILIVFFMTYCSVSYIAAVEKISMHLTRKRVTKRSYQTTYFRPGTSWLSAMCHFRF